MDSEVKEIVYIAISAILLSIVLGFISIVWNVQRDIAQMRNEEVFAHNRMVRQREFSKYNKRELVGEEVIECIRMHYDSGITIYVASSAITHRVFNLEEYSNPDKRRYFSVREGSIILQWFNNSKRFRSYLVFNSEPPQAKFTRIMSAYRLTPESVSGTIEDKVRALDRVVGNPITNSEVTGILIIDHDDL